MKILVAGSTGYLGSHIIQQLQAKGINYKALARNEKKLIDKGIPKENIIKAEVTNQESLTRCCKGIDVVISTVGITRQKDKLTYMDVDYQANANLLAEAIKNGVKKFIYISAINGDKYRHLKIFEAKEKFVDELQVSGIDYAVIRPNGFFSDMKDFLDMAKKGTVYLFGNGNPRLNPIAGEDLAEFVIDSIESHEKNLPIGGAEIFTQNELASLALKAWDKPIKIKHLPDWIRRFTIWIMRTFTSVKTYGSIEFFLSMMADDNVAPTYGKHKLGDFFNDLVKN